MGRVRLTKAEILEQPHDLWWPVLNAVSDARNADIGAIPEGAVYVYAVMRTDGAMNNGGWALAIDDYTANAVKSVGGFRYFGLATHASLIEKALELYRGYEHAKSREDEEETERLADELNLLDSAYYELDAPNKALEAVIRAHPERFEFDVEVPDDAENS